MGERGPRREEEDPVGGPVLVVCAVRRAGTNIDGGYAWGEPQKVVEVSRFKRRVNNRIILDNI